MPKFLTFKSPSSSDLKENPIKALYESFLSFDRFTKGFLIVLLLILISTPFLVNNLLIFKPHAQETEPTLGEQTPPIPPSVPDEIVIKFKAGVDEKVKDNIRSAHGLSKKDEIKQISVELNKVPEKAKNKIIEALKKNPRIEYAEPNYLGKLQDTPNDPCYTASTCSVSYDGQWFLPKIAASQAWDISQGSPNVTVAISDSGVNSNHEDLIGKIVPGYNFYSNTTDTSDVTGHGTGVAGMIGAATNNGKGVASLGRNVTVMPFVDCNSTGSCSSYSASQSITYAADHGAKVANMSWGGTVMSSSVQNAINYGWSKGMVFTASAGNYASTPVLYPAGGQNVIAVGMTGSNSPDEWANSNYGTGLDVVAPGVALTTTAVNGGYGIFSGTSFSSPLTAALAALIMSANPGLTNQQVVDIILQTADKAGTVSGVSVTYDDLTTDNCNGWNQYMGCGRINAGAALQKAVGSTAPPPDTVSPTAKITNPTLGSILSGVVDFSADVTDNVGVAKVEFHYNCNNGTDVTLAVDTVAPYVASWDTTKCPNNNSTYIYVKAYDAAGNTNSISDTLINNLTINNTAQDTTPPTTSITSPTAGSTVSGTNTTISASASDNVALSTVSIFVDGNVVTSCPVSGTSSNCSYTLDTTTVPNGSHTIQSKALDSSNNLGQSTTITVNVNNIISTPTPIPSPSSTLSPTPSPTPTSSDITKPTVIITNPLNGSTVAKGSTVTITASPSDNIGITKVEFFINTASSPKCTDTTPPYTCNWKVPGKTNATYTLTAKAYDPSGNTGTGSVVVTGR